MATLLFAGAGAAIGAGLVEAGIVGAGAFWGLTAVQWGWNLGGVAGMLLRGNDTNLPIIEVGQKLADTRVLVSSNGQMLPIVIGRAPSPCNVIWSTPKQLHEVITSQEVGGKGGGQEQLTVTRWYTASFVAAVCEGTIAGAINVKFNGQVVAASASTDSPAVVLSGSVNVKIHDGGPDQEPLSIIEADKGVGNVSGYRGTALLEVTDLDLTPYGNELPRLVEVEVVKSGTIQTLAPVLLYTIPGGQSISNAFGNSEQFRSFLPVQNGTQAWVVLMTGGNPRKVALINCFTGEEIVSYTASANCALMGTGFNGRVWFQEYAVGLMCMDTTGRVRRVNEPSFTQFDGNLRLERCYETPALDLPESQEDAPWLFVQYNSTSVSTWPIYKVTSINLTADNSGNTSTQILTGQGLNYWMENALGVDGRIYAFCATAAGLPNWGYADTSTGAWTTFGSYSQVNGSCPGGVGTDGFIYVRSGNTGEANILEKWTQDGVLVDTLTIPNVGTTEYGIDLHFVFDDEGYLLLQVFHNSGGNVDIHRINLGTFAVEDTNNSIGVNYWVHGASPFMGRGSIATRLGTNNTEVYEIDGVPRITPDVLTLDDAVSAICVRPETLLTSGDLDVTDLTTVPFKGITITNRGTGREALELLQTTYLVDVVASEYKLKFRKRGSAAVVTFFEADLGVVTERSQAIQTPLVTSREEGLVLPFQVDVTYLSLDNNYLVGKQTAKRQVTNAKHAITISVPIVLSDVEAYQLAHKVLFMMSVGRTTYEFQSPALRYSEFEPTDMCNLSVDGKTLLGRIVERNEGFNNVVRWKATADHPGIYSQDSYSTPTDGPPSISAFSGPTEAALADMHLVSDVHNLPGFNFVMRGLDPSFWSSAALYQSKDGGITYNPMLGTSVSNPGAWGRALTTLPDRDPDLIEQFDWAYDLDVYMPRRALSSFSADQVMAGECDALLYNKEIIAWINSSVIATDTYRLSGILRGRKGTESYMAGHAVGDRCIVLDTTLGNAVQTLSDLNRIYQYKPVSNQQPVDQAAALTFQNKGLRLKPLSLKFLRAGAIDASNTMRIEATRRTRVTNPWRDGVDAPLGETAEQYRFDILGLDGATVLRTLNNVVPSVDYSPADQITDFGDTQAALRVTGYQVSPEFGLGYPSTKSVGETDPYRSSVGILLPLNGIDGVKAVQDAIGNVWTLEGDTQLDTAQFKFGNASLLFDGSGDGMTTPDGPNVTMETGDFTIDLQFRPNSTAGNSQLCNKNPSANYGPFVIRTVGTSIVIHLTTVNGSWSVANAVAFGTIAAGNWYHVSLERYGNNFYAYLNGVGVFIASTVSALYDNGQGFCIGRGWSSEYVNGWMDMFRLTLGVARYKGSNFTPPTKAYPNW